ncbi:MAG: putative Methyl-accepting chemotaxis protein [Rhodospirillaceae bacterium]|nr:MAG: putative Methyl-accepting chemotaxis protein [Rhodospirillaceae bacterium]
MDGQVMSIKIKAAGLFFSVALVVVALVVATTTVSVVESVTTSRTSWTLFNTAFAKQAALSTLQGAAGYGGMIHNFKNYVLRQDAPRIKAIEQNMADVRAAIESLRATGVNGAEEAALTDIARVVAAYADRLPLVREMAGKGEDPRAIDKVIKVDDGPALKGIATITAEVAKTVRHSNDTLAATMDRMESLAGVVLVVVTIVLFVFALINLWWIGVRLIRPMTAMVETMGRLAGGNTAIDVPGRSRGDEIGAMATAVTVFRDSMIEADRLRAEQASAQEQAQRKRRQEIESFADTLEEKVSGSIMAVFQGAGDITATAGRMGAKIDQSSGRSLEAAEASERASHDINTVATATEELSTSIKEIRRQVAQSAEISSHAVTAAEQTNGKVRGLSESAQKIGEVVRLINDIASQTNLLALSMPPSRPPALAMPVRASRSLPTK